MIKFIVYLSSIPSFVHINKNKHLFKKLKIMYFEMFLVFPPLCAFTLEHFQSTFGEFVNSKT